MNLNHIEYFHGNFDSFAKCNSIQYFCNAFNRFDSLRHIFSPTDVVKCQIVSTTTTIDFSFDFVIVCCQSMESDFSPDESDDLKLRLVIACGQADVWNCAIEIERQNHIVTLCRRRHTLTHSMIAFFGLDFLDDDKATNWNKMSKRNIFLLIDSSRTMHLNDA